MRVAKEKVTKTNIVEAFRNLFTVMGYDYHFSGYKDTIYTFELCSNYGCELAGSTIDKIELTPEGRIYFYYNQNMNELETINNFVFSDLELFYNSLVDAWNDLDYVEFMERCTECDDPY